MSKIKAEEREGIIKIENDEILLTYDLSSGYLNAFDKELPKEAIFRSFAQIILEGEKDSLCSTALKYERAWEKEEVTDELGEGERIKLTHTQLSSKPDICLYLTLYQESPFFILQVSVKNSLDKEIKIKELSPFAMSSQEGSRLNLGSSPENLSFYKQGWQSWSPTFCLKVKDKDSPCRFSLGRRMLESYPGRDKSELTAEGVGVVKDLKSNKALLLGFVSFEEQLTQIRLKMRGKDALDLRVISSADGWTLSPNEELFSERLLVNFKESALTSLSNYAKIIRGEKADISPPTGWSSWYYYFNRLKEEDIIENLKVLSESKDKIPLEYFQIDDGYQESIGDWTTINNKFPRGIKWLAERIKEAGFKPGIWLAPFIVSPSSSLYRQHPDWVLKDKRGKKVLAGVNPLWRGIRYFALDCTHPGVIDYLKETFKTIVKDWGFEFLKLDFIFAAALAGEHYERQITRAQAYRRGLKAIREAVGDETFILGCGAPLLPSLGLVDGMRVSQDVDFSWRSWLKFLVGERYVMGAGNSMHNTMTRYFMHRNFFLNDPDCLLVREDKSKLTEEEVKSLTAVIGLSGGMVLSSDNLTTLSKIRANYLSLLLPPYGSSATPVDLFEREVPQIFSLKVEKSFSTWYVVGVFNWEEKEEDIEVDFSLLGLPKGKSYHLFEFWQEEYQGVFKERVKLEKIPPHGNKLLVIKEVSPYPQILATTLHLSSGGVEIKESYYSKTLAQLYFKLSLNRKAEGKIVVSIPEGFKVQKVYSNAYSQKTKVEEDILIIEVSEEKEAEFRVDFEKDKTT